MTENKPTTTDHDLLTKLDTKFEIFTTQYQIDIRDLKDNTKTQLADHELRLSTLEASVNNFVIGAKTTRLLIGIVSGTIGGGIAIIGFVTKLFGLIH